MKITVLTICYNEEKILPYFLRHYLDFADKIVVYDNQSNDLSKKIISMHDKVELYSYNTNNTLDDKKYLEIKNNAWKKYSSDTDWQIVVDVDEFLYHPNIFKLLKRYKNMGVTIPSTKGFNMVTDTFPVDNGKQLKDIVRDGVYNQGMSKSVVFNPKLIKEINYGPGAHNCNPYGKVNYSGKPELSLLHYKYFGIDYFKERAKLYAPRLKKIDYDWGQKDYINQQYADEKMYEKWARSEKSSRVVFSSDLDKFLYKIRHLPLKDN